MFSTFNITYSISYILPVRRVRNLTILYAFYFLRLDIIWSYESLNASIMREHFKTKEWNCENSTSLEPVENNQTDSKLVVLIKYYLFLSISILVFSSILLAEARSVKSDEGSPKCFGKQLTRPEDGRGTRALSWIIILIDTS